MAHASWPDPQRPGVPRNPERDGAHRLRHKHADMERDALWSCGGTWLDTDGDFSIPHAAAFYEYLGPCIPPADLAAHSAAAAAEMRERSAEAADRQLPHPDTGTYFVDGARMMRENIRHAIAALPLPGADALARVRDQARREGLEDAAVWYAAEGWLLDEDDVPAAIRALAQEGPTDAE